LPAAPWQPYNGVLAPSWGLLVGMGYPVQKPRPAALLSPVVRQDWAFGLVWLLGAGVGWSGRPATGLIWDPTQGNQRERVSDDQSSRTKPLFTPATHCDAGYC
jgi:hypothetical protein